MSDDEKKIIIDEDWKSQVEREKVELESKADDPEEQKPGPNDIPPASFEMLVTSIGTQAMMCLGQVPDPASGQAIYHPDLARHHIDTLAVVQEKTKGNLTKEEDELIENFVNQLRQLFIATQEAVAQMPPTPPGPGGPQVQ